MNPFSNQIKDVFPDTVSIGKARNSALEQLSETEFPSPQQEIWKYSKIFNLDLESLNPSFNSPDDKKTEPSFLDIKDSGLISINDGWLGNPKSGDFLDSSQGYLGSLANMGNELSHIEENFDKPKDFFDCLEYVISNLATVPTVSLCLGPVAGLGAARAVSSHYSVMVKDLSQLFVAGPPVVNALGIEEVDKESLGGSQIQTRY